MVEDSLEQSDMVAELVDAPNPGAPDHGNSVAGSSSGKFPGRAGAPSEGADGYLGNCFNHKKEGIAPARRRLQRLVRPSLVKMLIRQNSARH